MAGVIIIGVAIITLFISSGKIVSTNSRARPIDPRQGPSITKTTHTAWFVLTSGGTAIVVIRIVVIALL